MTTLREEIRKLAEEAERGIRAEQLKHLDQFVAAKDPIESAILEGVKLVLERVAVCPSCAKMLPSDAGHCIKCYLPLPPSGCSAMTRELLKELNG